MPITRFFGPTIFATSALRLVSVRMRSALSARWRARSLAAISAKVVVVMLSPSGRRAWMSTP